MLNNGQIDKAATEFQKAVELEPRLWQSHFSLGILWEQQGRMDDAVKQYERTLELQPQHILAANNLAWLYAETGSNLEKAWNLAEMAREQYPENPNILDTLGWIYFKTGSYQRALKLFEESIQLSPNTPTLYYHLGRAQEQNRDLVGARISLEKALELNNEFAEADSARIILAALEETPEETEKD